MILCLVFILAVNALPYLFLALLLELAIFITESPKTTRKPPENHQKPPKPRSQKQP